MPEESNFCYDCVPHFKTRTVTKKTLRKDEFKDSVKLQNQIKKNGQAEIYYCRLGRAEHRVYIPACEQSVDYIAKLPACECFGK